MDLHHDRSAPRDFTALLTTAQKLRITTVPSRVRFAWLGVDKALAPDLRDRAARGLVADPASIAATKKLVDTRHPAFRAVTAVRGRIVSDWRALSLPFPERGIRLLRLEDVEYFRRLIDARSRELRDAANALEARFDELKADAARRLGTLYDPDDYPPSLLHSFSVHLDFPNPEPPPHLAWFSPGEHQTEEFAVDARFEEAARMAELALLGEFAVAVAGLAEQLAGLEGGGAPRPFRDAAVAELQAAIGRHRRFDLRLDSRLDEIVGLVGLTLEGVTPQRLRDRAELKRTVAARLSWARASLAPMVGDPP